MIELFNGSNKQNLLQSEIAVQRYASVNAYMAYEGQIYWTRAQFFLTANALLTAFALPVLPTSLNDETLARIIIGTGASVAGLILTWLWIQSLKAGEYWLDHWQSVLRELEKDAYGDLLLHREFPPKKGRVPAKPIAHHTAQLFYGVWVFVLAYVSFFAIKLFCSVI